MRRCRLGWASEGRTLSEDGLLTSQLNTEKLPAMGIGGAESSGSGSKTCKGPGAGVILEDEEGRAVQERNGRGRDRSSSALWAKVRGAGFLFFFS